MNKAFVDTTVLTDALLKPGTRANSARSLIRSFHESLLPVYAIKEFKAGPLHHYVWFHGKLVTTNSWEKTLTQLRKMAGAPFKARWVSTAIEALEAGAHKNRTATLGRLRQKYGDNATEDRVICDRYRYTLHSIIMRGWRQRRKITSQVVDELDCYNEAELTEERGLIDIGETECFPKDECALAERLRQDAAGLKAMYTAVAGERDKPENIKRSQVLNDLIRVPNRKLTSKQCRHLGDAIFACCCPSDAVILTTNERDLRPLAESLGKKVQGPQAPQK